MARANLELAGSCRSTEQAFGKESFKVSSVYGVKSNAREE